jgi:hypothetical protein
MTRMDAILIDATYAVCQVITGNIKNDFFDCALV